MTDLELIQEILEKPIAFHKVFFDITQDVKAALFLSQAFYWSKRMNHDWYYKTIDSWEEETGLNRREQETIKKRLKSLKLLETKLIGVPATLHFKFDFERLISLAKQYYSQYGRKCQTSMAESAKPVCTEVPNQYGRKCHTLYRTENTTENTTEKKNSTSNEVLQENEKFSCPPSQNVPYEKIVKIYHEKLPQLPKVEIISNTRKAKLKTCWSQKATEQFKPQDLVWWQDYFDYVGRVPFLLGENNKGWRANFDFLTNLNSLVKVMEGFYEGGKNVQF